MAAMVRVRPLPADDDFAHRCGQIGTVYAIDGETVVLMMADGLVGPFQRRDLQRVRAVPQPPIWEPLEP